MQDKKTSDIAASHAGLEGALAFLDSNAVKSRTAAYQQGHHAKVIQRFSPQKNRAVAMGRYLLENSEMLGELLSYTLAKGEGCKKIGVGSGNLDCGTLPTVQKVQSMGVRLLACRNVLLFRDWQNHEKITLAKMLSCSQRLFCPLCGIARANKLAMDLLAKSKLLKESVPGVRTFFATTTIRNGSDLAERFGHLDGAFTKLMQRAKEYRRRGGRSSFAGVVGGAASFEVKVGLGSQEWHPHVHSLLVPEGQQWIRVGDLREEWQVLTSDSHVVDVREIDPADPEAILEIAKYSLKFSEMSLGDNAIAGLLLRRRRLFRTFGKMRCTVQNRDDEDIDDTRILDGPFAELLYKHNGRKYDLVKVTEISEESVERKLVQSVSRESELRQAGELWAKKEQQNLNRKMNGKMRLL